MFINVYCCKGTACVMANELLNVIILIKWISLPSDDNVFTHSDFSLRLEWTFLTLAAIFTFNLS